VIGVIFILNVFKSPLFDSLVAGVRVVVKEKSTVKALKRLLECLATDFCLNILGVLSVCISKVAEELSHCWNCSCQCSFIESFESFHCIDERLSSLKDYLAVEVFGILVDGFNSIQDTV
jgi:hypothetical protein